MPYCCRCFTYFQNAGWSGPAEDCDCGQNESAEDARRDYLNEQEPSETELETRREELKDMK